MPLSHAICCRPCLPEELPQLNAAIAADDKAVAIMSIGCHSSRGSGPDTLKCEDGSNSVVSGVLPKAPAVFWLPSCGTFWTRRVGRSSPLYLLLHAQRTPFAGFRRVSMFSRQQGGCSLVPGCMLHVC